MLHAAKARDAENGQAPDDEDDGLCLLCAGKPRTIRYVPCGHCVTCKSCTVRHVLAQLKNGELRPRCSHGCGAEILHLIQLTWEQESIGRTPRIYQPVDEGEHTCRSLADFLTQAAAEADADSDCLAANEAAQQLKQTATARLQLFFFDAIEMDDYEECARLLAQGASVNAPDEQELTPLHVCAQLGHLALAEWLVSEGASLEAEANGQVALHYACVHGHLEFAQWLVREGADPDCRSDSGAVPLHGACQEGYISVVEWLLKCGAAVSAMDDEGAQPLHAACQEGHCDVARLLLANGADIRAVDGDGRAPLHAACVNGHLEVAEWLVSEGAAVEVTDRIGKRPIDFARANNHHAVVELLERTKSAADVPVPE